MKLTKLLILLLLLSLRGFSQQAVLTSSGENVILNFLSSLGGTVSGTLTTKAGINNTGTITNTGTLINTGDLTVNGIIYASNLNVSGAITAGTWSATAIDITKGGTGATTSSDALINIGAAPLNANLINKTGTAYTLSASDNGKVVTLDNPSSITLTVPIGLAAGFNCMIIQKGLGIVTITPASSVTVTNRSGGTKTGGQNAIVTIISISSNYFITGGDMQ